MKTKDKDSIFCDPMFILFLSGIAFIIVTVISLYQREKGVSEFGYIPENQIQMIKWAKEHSDLNRYYPEVGTAVVTDKDTVMVYAGNYFSRVYIPPSKGKKVFVKLTKVFGRVTITEASLTPLK